MSRGHQCDTCQKFGGGRQLGAWFEVSRVDDTRDRIFGAGFDSPGSFSPIGTFCSLACLSDRVALCAARNQELGV